MIRTYGKSPYTAAVVHGGPGDRGSLAGMAQRLSRVTGVLEPIQSECTVEGLTDELYTQVRHFSSDPVTLAGHSWGAWLAALCAAKYPQCAKRLVLVGCGPFEERYVPLITENRLKKLRPAQVLPFKTLSEKLIRGMADKTDIQDLEGFLERTDNYCLRPGEQEGRLPFNGRMHASVWEQADRMRATSELAASLGEIKCPVYVVHGSDDPHPLSGVVEPLSARGIRFETHVLPRCGHSPFREKYAAGRFFRIMEDILDPRGEYDGTVAGTIE